ncbi:hypothetical protein FISHEDRAFT_68755 [Fistulina hepatica ATCC 64428]|uniref:Uncharacterized protein n=1 Tax=Fistulina hepatica ATCC 64428 TaxID=1128425 RepID=A0A0D7AP49_9AGAR|nr:hypothetical protein FISHEDRAFT_68755 [Fistulina hepatica ATCC 64428]
MSQTLGTYGRNSTVSIPWLDYKPADGDAKSVGIDDAVSELTALQELAVSDVLLCPGTLRRCVAPIEYIFYRGSAEHMQELVDVLSSPDVLPTLRLGWSLNPTLKFIGGGDAVAPPWPLAASGLRGLIGKVYNAEVLLDTLRARPDVAGTVRSIKFGTPYFYREETENHAAIIWLCRNLVALDLCGWNGFARAPLVEAVRSAHTLKSICINHLGISDADSEGDAFCSGLELLRMMRVWPGIEEVVIHVSALSAEFYNDSTEVPESDSNRESDDEPGSTHAEWKEERRVLAERRQFDQTTDWSNATHACATCNSTATLHISIPWLDYKPADGDAKSAGIDDAVSELTALQELAVSDVLLCPGTLRRCVAPIEYIFYRGSAEHMQELVDVLSSPDVLPTLRVFRSSDAHLHSELQTVLRARNVSVNPQCEGPDMYGPFQLFETWEEEKFRNYYGDNGESDDDGEEDSDSFDEDNSAE